MRKPPGILERLVVAESLWSAFDKRRRATGYR